VSRQTPRLILASTSPRRIALLRERGIAFETANPQVEELADPLGDPPALVAANARLKAEAVPFTAGEGASSPSSALVLGADTVVVFQSRILGKPASWDEARAMLGLLNGQTHEVLTGVHLRLHPGGAAIAFVESTRVHFHSRSEAERESYLQKINPLDKAGAYAAQEDEGWLIASLSGSKTNVIGLPMERLLAELTRFGIRPA
jgi:septum formation protein